MVSIFKVKASDESMSYEGRIKKKYSLIRNTGKQEIAVRMQRQTGKKKVGVGSRDSK
jgi:hypothetical protein